MNSIIRPMTPKDKNSVLEMMRVFYASPAVFTNGSDDIFRTDIENCINDNPYLEGAGIGSKFIDYIGEKYPDAILRLEVEEENERAVNVYKKNGFSFLPYLEMKK